MRAEVDDHAATSGSLGNSNDPDPLFDPPLVADIVFTGGGVPGKEFATGNIAVWNRARSFPAQGAIAVSPHIVPLMVADQNSLH
jgi:hypothetical protein